VKYTEESIRAIADFITASDIKARESGKIQSFRSVESTIESLKRFFTLPEIDTIITNKSDIRDVLCNAGIISTQ
jgi:hypothetical protein